MTKKNVFISYSRSDLEFVEKLVNALKEHGIDVWFDKHLRTGGDWDDRLEEEINKADHMIIIWSKRSVKSENVKNEISFAKRSNTTFHPIKIEECETPISMARQHYRDFIRDFDNGVIRLVEDLNYEEISIDDEKIVKTEKDNLENKKNPDDSNEGSNNKSRLIRKFVIGFIAIAAIVTISSVIISNKNLETELNMEKRSAEWDRLRVSSNIDEIIAFVNKNGNNNYKSVATARIKQLLPKVGRLLFKDSNGISFRKIFSTSNIVSSVNINDVLQPYSDRSVHMLDERPLGSVTAIGVIKKNDYVVVQKVVMLKNGIVEIHVLFKD